MLDRNRILAIIDAAYASRAAGDKAALEQFWAPDATYKMVGEAGLLERYPVGPLDANEATRAIIDLVAFHALERIDAIVEGNKAAVLWNVTMSSGESGECLSQLYDLWELDDDGRAQSLIQFADTALVAAMIAA